MHIDYESQKGKKMQNYRYCCFLENYMLSFAEHSIGIQILVDLNADGKKSSRCPRRIYKKSTPSACDNGSSQLHLSISDSCKTTTTKSIAVDRSFK